MMFLRKYEEIRPIVDKLLHQAGLADVLRDDDAQKAQLLYCKRLCLDLIQKIDANVQS